MHHTHHRPYKHLYFQILQISQKHLQNPKRRRCSHLHPGGPSPHKMAQTFDGQPTLERSGSEQRRAVTSSRP